MFMDFHKGLNVSVEDVKRAHIADESVQSKYGVVYHQFWVNEAEGTVFCLMEGPDKKSCEAVHREAHGNVACSILEVSPGFYKLFMGEDHLIEGGHVTHADGKPDVGVRYILVLSIQGRTTAQHSAEYRILKPPYEARKLVHAILTRFAGREISRLHDDSVAAVFDSPADAAACCIEMRSQLMRRKTDLANEEWNITFKMGLAPGQPVTETGDFFSEAITLARRLCAVAADDELVVSPRFGKHFDIEALARESPSVRLLNTREEEFISALFSVSEQKLSDEFFTVDVLSRSVGMSRPQLYRKTVSLTGKSPNDFIRDLRMRKALELIRRKAGNICEIALEVGYNNPSYFAKCFQLRYGCSPSRFES